MSDQGVAAIVGLAVVIGLRLLDYFFPRGYVYKKVKQWSVPLEDDDPRSAHDHSSRKPKKKPKAITDDDDVVEDEV